MNSDLARQAKPGTREGAIIIKNQGMPVVIADPASTGTRNDAGEGFDLVKSRNKRAIRIR